MRGVTTRQKTTECQKRLEKTLTKSQGKITKNHCCPNKVRTINHNLLFWN